MYSVKYRHLISYTPIGIIYTPHKTEEQTPIQPVYSKGIKGKIEIFDPYLDGLRDLEGFSHLFLIYHFHKSKETKLILKPFLDNIPGGVFSTRAPYRPNPIGLSIVKLIKIEKNLIHIEDVDILNETPLLDIKPYISRFDFHQNVHCGWQDSIDEETAQKKGKRKD